MSFSATSDVYSAAASIKSSTYNIILTSSTTSTAAPSSIAILIDTTIIGTASGDTTIISFNTVSAINFTTFTTYINITYMPFYTS